MNIRTFLLLSVFIIFVASCIQPPEYSNTPEIQYVGINKQEIVQGSGRNQDELIVEFSYTDGDGNIGARQDSLMQNSFFNNIVFIDNRTGLETFNGVPTIPRQGVGSGISGVISVKIPTELQGVCCIYDDKDGEDPCTPSTTFPTDTFTYTIYIIDQDFNESNRIETEPIVVLCQ
ncbi:MAG: hypothetical protein AAFO82_17455 [Bacteroidota bacterium]